ncbi:signal recognition particle, SRP9/SRP14 subunit [Bombardia bombarda]|uniref:Signal recognition particle subunit SRP14 n=1 Tax=Bombardia bombarda TaxID=252184 RepID=A0AA39T131_9PEZI|nr:signal recognition particle, SRP9/SRP14 subunit [Bombardia bombarda]
MATTDHMTHDEFFARLAELFEQRKNKDHGKVYLTQKRLSYGQEPTTTTPSSPSASSSQQQTGAPFADLLDTPSKPLPVLIRATNGKSKQRRKEGAKLKVSTVVQPDELDAFYARYADACKAGMAALKPRDRTKRKAKARLVKKKGGAGQSTMSAIP